MASDATAYARGVSHNFWKNVVLLGFSSNSRSKGGDKVKYDEKMFESNGSNEVGMLDLCYFLLRLLVGKSLKIRKMFSSCYPIYDNSQRREFKANVRKLIAELESTTERILPKGYVKPSALNLSKGKAAQTFLWILSHIVMCREIDRHLKGKENNNVKESSLEKVLSSISVDVCNELKMTSKEEERLLKEHVEGLSSIEKEILDYEDELERQERILIDELNKTNDEIENEKKLAKEVKEHDGADQSAVKNSMDTLLKITDKAQIISSKVVESVEDKNLLCFNETNGEEVLAQLRKWNQNKVKLSDTMTNINEYAEIEAIKDLSKDVEAFTQTKKLVLMELDSCKVRFDDQRIKLARSAITE